MTPAKKSVVRKPTVKKRVSRKSMPAVLNSEAVSALAEPVVVALPHESVIPPIPLPDRSAAEPVSAAAEEDSLYTHASRLLVVVLFLGWAFDYLFWKQGVGINFAIFMSVSILGGMIWLLTSGLRPASGSLWLLLPFLFFAVITFMRQEPLTLFLAFTFTLLASGLFASTYLGGRWPLYGLTDLFSRFFLFVVDLLFAPTSYLSRVRTIAANTGIDKRVLPVWALLRGLLIALPIVLCFASLLAAGDLVFKEKLNDFFDMKDLPENILRGVLILFYAYFLAGAFLHAAQRSRDENLLGETKPVLKPFLGFTESAVILGSVSALFLAFVIVQFQYFFGGQTNIGVEGYTYSQYARRGFNELVIVAFFSLVLIFGLNSVTRRESDAQRRTYSVLSVVLVALVTVILVSAYQRIALAIDWHGFSRLRLYPRIFLIWLGLLFVTVVVLEFVRKERYLAFAALLASAGFAVTLTMVNVDAATVKHNVPRTLKGKNLNVAHLASLSSDAVPALAREFYSEAYPQWVHEGIGAALTCYLHYDPYDDSADNWRSFNLSRWRAHISLQNVEKYLQEYGIDDEKYWDVKARTPSDVWYPCEYDSSAEEE